MPRAIVTVGLANGDCGKGSITDFLCRHHRIRTVVRYSGGSNCAHSVITPDNLHHTFSTWGSGTLAGAATVLTKHVIIDPVRLYNEGRVLEGKGVFEPWRRLFVDRDALVITPFHRALNRLREIERNDRHGSCGVGVGETVRYALANTDNALRFKDLLNPARAEEKLYAIRHDLEREVPSLILSCEEKNTFADDNVIDAFLHRCHRLLATDFNIWDTSSILELISNRDTVWEGAQGVLLDEDIGFHPYTTWSKTRLINATQTLAEAGVTDSTNIGVLRTYGCRHGPGPFPSEDESLRDNLPEPHNPTNEWQREFRVGWFDLVMAKYALSAAGRVDELAITHVDALEKLDMWPVVTDYAGPVPPPDCQDLMWRESQTKDLMMARAHRRVEYVHRDFYLGYLSERLQRPITITSHGLRADQKRCYSTGQKSVKEALTTVA